MTGEKQGDKEIPWDGAGDQIQSPNRAPLIHSLQPGPIISQEYYQTFHHFPVTLLSYDLTNGLILQWT